MGVRILTALDLEAGGSIYNMIGAGTNAGTITSTPRERVPTIAAMYADTATKDQEYFVLDAGDGKWAVYISNGTGTQASGNTYTKLADQDALENAITAAAVKNALDTLPDVNTITDTQLQKLIEFTSFSAQAVRETALVDLTDTAGNIGATDSILTFAGKVKKFITDFATNVLNVKFDGLNAAVFTNIAATDSIASLANKSAYYLNFFDKRVRESVLSGFTVAGSKQEVSDGQQLQVVLGIIVKRLQLLESGGVTPPSVRWFAQFDGVDANITTPNFALDLSTTNFTFHLIVRFPANTSGATQIIMEKGIGGIICLLSADNRLRIGLSNTTPYYLDTAPLTPELWYDIIFTYDQATDVMEGFLNGAQYGTKTASMPVSAINNSGIHFGSRNTTTRAPFPGEISLVEWWSNKKTAEQVANIVQGGASETNLILQLRMEGNANDTSGLNNHGVLFGGPVFTNEPITA